VEGQKPEPIRVEEHHWYPWYSTSCYDPYKPYWEGASFPQWTTILTSGNQTTTFDQSGYNVGGGRTYSCSAMPATSDCNKNDVQCDVGVGAGQYVSQPISYVQGLTKPVLAETLRLKVLWWDHLVEKLRAQDNQSVPQPSGFPADKPKGIDLKTTPRIKEAEKLLEQRVNAWLTKKNPTQRDLDIMRICL
jgi:hypothetical protein